MNRKLFIVETFRDLQIMAFYLKVLGQVNWRWWEIFAPSIAALALYGLHRLIQDWRKR